LKRVIGLGPMLSNFSVLKQTTLFLNITAVYYFFTNSSFIHMEEIQKNISLKLFYRLALVWSLQTMIFLFFIFESSLNQIIKISFRRNNEWNWKNIAFYREKNFFKMLKFFENFKSRKVFFSKFDDVRRGFFFANC